jgi:hypothetical protein
MSANTFSNFQPVRNHDGINSLPLKILLQDRKSRLYFRGTEQWTQHREEALNFQHSAKASGFVLQGRLPNMDIILGFTDARSDLRIPCSLPAHDSGVLAK